MSYEGWRISFQDSEQAAKAAFEEAQRYGRLFAMAIGSVVELAEAAGIRKEDQLMGGTAQALDAIEKLKQRRDKWKARALVAEQLNTPCIGVGIKPETMPSQSAPASCTLPGGRHAAD
ncbi:hypothetical protein [Vreelandella sp.]|uniref:hypothetical protein n=1 Tax=Vreelandella sp. TaxID=3137778 RepID=UPI003BA8E2E7